MSGAAPGVAEDEGAPPGVAEDEGAAPGGEYFVVIMINYDRKISVLCRKKGKNFLIFSSIFSSKHLLFNLFSSTHF